MGKTFPFDNHTKSEVEGCPKRKKPHSDFDTHFRMFLHILRLVKDVSRYTNHIIITNWHTISLRDHVHTPHSSSDDAASKLRRVMRLPPPAHEILHFSCMKSP